MDRDAKLNEIIRRGDQLRRRRRLSTTLTAVAAVCVLTGAVIAVVARSEGHRDDVVVVDTPETVLPIPSVEAGKQAVSYHGIEVLVPAEWTLRDAQCGTPQRNTVLTPVGAVDACLIGQPAGLTVVRIEHLDDRNTTSLADFATTEVTLDGHPARRGTVSAQPPARPQPFAVLVVPHLEVVVTVEAPDITVAAQILDDARIVPIDSNGCPDRIANLEHPPPSGIDGTRDRTVPGTPKSLSICRYADNWLARSDRADDAELQRIAEILNALTEGTTVVPGDHTSGCERLPEYCQRQTSEGFVLRFSYPDGHVLPIHARFAAQAEMSVANGDRVTKVSQALIEALTEHTGYDGAIVDPRTWP